VLDFAYLEGVQRGGRLTETYTIILSKMTYLKLLELRERFREVDPQVTLEDVIWYLIAYEAGEVEK